MPDKTYQHATVEDYVEIIAGFREPNGKQNYSIFNVGEPLVNLARYDMRVVPSLAEQTLGNRGYTDKQAKLALDLVLKYERQLYKKGVDVAPLKTNPQYRLPLRIVDRTQRLWMQEDQLHLKFPYDLKWIDLVRETARTSQGAVKFNRKTNVYDIDLTEWNLNWFYSFAQTNNFEIDAEVTALMQLVIAAETVPYQIELQYNDDVLSIANASPSLLEYIETNLGGLTTDNLIRLIDMAPVLGYTVDEHIITTMIAEFGPRFHSLCANRVLKVDSTGNTSLVRDIAAYAQATDRFPIFVFEPDMSGKLYDEFRRHFPEEIIRIDNRQRVDEFGPRVRIVYTTRIPKDPITRIPLMISSAGMLHGGDRQMWIQTAEKVVYFAKEVYNKNVKGSLICSLD